VQVCVVDGLARRVADIHSQVVSLQPELTVEDRCILQRWRTVLPGEEAAMLRRLATLFVDIAGSTRLVVHHPAETMLGVVQCFAELVTATAGAHGGRVKDFEGDGVLVYFESAVDAVEAAFAISAALERERCEAGCEAGPGAAVRMSVTLGDVAVGPVVPSHPALALVGASVNLGARLLKAVPPGSVAASAEVLAELETVAPALAQRFELLDSAFVVPGADGLTVPVYGLAEPGRSVA
jgi:class 3 adenylate cyclase